jgi:Flp pilus assembly protein CpaB
MQGNRLMLIIAIVAGVMATILAFAYINSATSAAEEREPEPRVSVLFVVNDLPANHALDPDADLRVDTVGAITSPGLARSAVKADERASLRGLRIGSPLPAGVPLLYSHLESIADIDLGQGMRAMAIDVRAANLMGGILVPGDRVDIIVSYRRPVEPVDMPEFDVENPQAGLSAMMGQVLSQAGGGVPSDWEAEEVLTNIRVIAIGSQLTFSRQAQMFGVAGGGGGGSSTVTLEVSPDQAKALIRSSAGGGNPLTLLLRPPHTPAETGGGSFQEG